MLTHIEFENYRIFKKRQALDIKPITLLFGKNNAGKSAVLKLPLLSISIALSAENGFTPFELEVTGIKIANSYRDLIYGRGNQAASFTFANNECNTIEVSFYVDIDRLKYEKCNHEIKDKNINTSIDYIGPFRSKPDLDLRIDNSRNLKTSGYDGYNTYQYLLRDIGSATHLLCDKVSQWYRNNFDGWAVEVDDKQNPVFHIEMRNSGTSVPIQDCGTGILQSLPIVIRACQPAEKPTLVVLEEPESHLNPAAHAELCQLIVDSTKDDSNKRYLIETHSHTFILRLQRLLAEGKISPNDVALYFVQYHEEERSSQLERIEMKEDGSIPQWPTGMFEEVMDEILAINNQRILKRK